MNESLEEVTVQSQVARNDFFFPSEIEDNPLIENFDGKWQRKPDSYHVAGQQQTYDRGVKDFCLDDMSISYLQEIEIEYSPSEIEDRHQVFFFRTTQIEMERGSGLADLGDEEEETNNINGGNFLPNRNDQKNHQKRFGRKSLANSVKKLFESGMLSDGQKATLSEGELRKSLKQTCFNEIGRKLSDKEFNAELTKKKCNQTRLISTLLAAIVRAFASPLEAEQLEQEIKRIQESRKIEEIHKALYQSALEPCRKELRGLFDPGDKFICLVLNIDYRYPATSKILILDGLPVLRRMMKEGQFRCNAWDPHKVQTRPNFDSLTAEIQNGTVGYEEVKACVQKECEDQEHLRKKTKSSNKNNISHFIRNILQDILVELKERQTDPGLREVIRDALDKNSGKPNKKNLSLALANPELRRLLREEFCDNHLLLARILRLKRTTVFMIHALVERYEKIKNMLTQDDDS